MTATTDHLTDVATHARLVAMAAQRRDEAIAAAHAAGASSRRIATAAGLSHTQVLTIVRRVTSS